MHLVLEWVALDTCSLMMQRRDEGHERLSLVLAEAELEYEALDEASSCQSAAHDRPHLGEHRVDQIQNELDTDLQLGWADNPAGAAGAGHRLPHGSLGEAVDHRRHTWAVAARHPAKPCEREQKPASEPRRE
jgi:hypothetical protein